MAAFMPAYLQQHLTSHSQINNKASEKHTQRKHPADQNNIFDLGEWYNPLAFKNCFRYIPKNNTNASMRVNWAWGFLFYFPSVGEYGNKR